MDMNQILNRSSMMGKRFFGLVYLLLGIAAGAQATGHWTINPYDFQYDMTVYIKLSVTNQDAYEVAAFYGDECRGVGSLMSVGDDVKYFYMRIRSNVESGEQISFRVYNTETNKEYLVSNTIEFGAQTVVGLPSNPLILNIVIIGDVNGDGIITAQDASLVQQLVAKKITPTTEGIVYDAADVNADGMVTAQDASLIQQHVAQKIDLSTINN
jgi:hypothetical protein